jgi:ABC-2 type transport system permease protein
MKPQLSSGEMIKTLVVKDWQIYQKQLAAYVIGLIIALSFLGMGSRWSFYLGLCALLCLLVCAGGFAIQSSLTNERKEQTLAFVMSLPITPLDFFWAKFLANLLIYLVPLLLSVGGTAFLVLFTPLPDGILVWSLLIYGLLCTHFFVCLSTALVVESEGWNLFVMIGLSVTVGPFIVGLGSIEAIGVHIKTNNIVWSLPALAIFAAEIVVSALAVVIARWLYSRKLSHL